jgi:hypothetical protein
MSAAFSERERERESLAAVQTDVLATPYAVFRASSAAGARVPAKCAALSGRGQGDFKSKPQRRDASEREIREGVSPCSFTVKTRGRTRNKRRVFSAAGKRVGARARPPAHRGDRDSSPAQRARVAPYLLTARDSVTPSGTNDYTFRCIKKKSLGKPCVLLPVSFFLLGEDTTFY